MKTLQKYKLNLIKEEEVSYLIDSKVSDPISMYKILQSLGLQEEPEEVFILLAFDTKNKLVGSFEVSRGTLSSSLVHPREIFKRALLINAAAIAVAHNHPSGEEMPSKEDKEVTRRTVEASNLMGINFLDHLIIGDTFFSFREKGLL